MALDSSNYTINFYHSKEQFFINGIDFTALTKFPDIPGSKHAILEGVSLSVLNGRYSHNAQLHIIVDTYRGNNL